MDIKPVFSSEVMLAGWSETHTGGAKVTFWLPDATELDVFRTMTVRKGGHAGQRFMCVLVEVGDDETPVPQGGQPQREQGGALARLSGIWCRTARFQEWLQDHAPGMWRDARDALMADGQSTEPDEVAGAAVRMIAGVSSRAALDHDAEAAERFHNLIRVPYAALLAHEGELGNP